MIDILTVPNTPQVQRVLITPEYSAICSIVEEPFHGQIYIDYYPEKYLIELVSLDTWLHSIAQSKLTVEGLCRLLYDACEAALGDIRLRVDVYAETTVHAPVRAIIQSRSYKNE